MRYFLIGLGIWIVLGLIASFLWDLVSRLDGEDPESVYQMSDDARIGWFLFNYILAPVSFLVIFIISLHKIFYKYKVALIEAIVAKRNMRLGKDNENDMQKEEEK